jgi:hypothetical protein
MGSRSARFRRRPTVDRIQEQESITLMKDVIPNSWVNLLYITDGAMPREYAFAAPSHVGVFKFVSNQIIILIVK